MRVLCSCLLLAFFPVVVNASDDLGAAIENVRAVCGGISSELNHLKRMAGINTAVTGVGAVAGGVALGTGIAKANVDKEVEELEKILNQLNELAEKQVLENPVMLVFDGPVQGGIVSADADGSSRDDYNISDVSAELTKKTQQSKNLGNWRTGTLAVSAASNIAGAVIAGNNRVKGDLKSQIDECLITVKNLSDVRMQARLSKTESDVDLGRAEKIINACGAWSTVNLGSINNKSTNATIASGIGAGLGFAGTVTSAVANSDSVRSGDSDKEKNLNTASNVLAGGTTVASGVAVVFNATQIGAIKRAVTVAEDCEEALK